MKLFHFCAQVAFCLVSIFAFIGCSGSSGSSTGVSGGTSFSQATQAAMDEGSLASGLLINLTRQGNRGDLLVRIDVVGGSATPFSDFTLTGGLTQFFTIPDGSSSEQVNLGNVLDDSDAEGTETIGLRLSHVVAGIPLGNETTLIIEINDDDTPIEGAIQFAATTGQVDEGSGAYQIALTRTSGAAGSVTAEIAVVGGFAVPGMDYTIATHFISWSDQDQAIKFIDLSIINDTLEEGGEQIVFEIINTTGGAIVGTSHQFFLEIVDDDVGGEIQFLAPGSNVMEGDSVTVVVVRTGGSGGPASVEVRDTGTGTASVNLDYDFGPAYVPGAGETITWAAGEIGPKSVILTANTDNFSEATETIELELTNPVGDVVISNSEGVTELNILDVVSTNVGSFAFATSTQMVAEQFALVHVSINRIGGSSQAVDVSFAVVGDSATEGVDFFYNGSGVLSWGDGDMNPKSVLIQILSDTLVEGDESFHVLLTGATAGATVSQETSEVVIIDNDFDPWAAISIPTTATIRGIDFFGPDFGWAVGDGGEIWERSGSANGGIWTQRTSNTTARLNSVIGELSLGAIAVGEVGTIVVADVASNNVWNIQSSGTTENLNAITQVQETVNNFTQIRYHVVGDNGTILRSVDSINWSALSSGTSEDLLGVDYFDLARGLAVGKNGTILRTTNGGQNWTAHSSGTTEDLHDVYFWSPVSAIVVGNNGTIIGTTSSGDFWFPLVSGTTGNLMAMHGISEIGNTTIRVVGMGGTILASTNFGNTWVPQMSNSTADYYGVDFVTNLRGYVGGELGEVMTAHAGGF